MLDKLSRDKENTSSKTDIYSKAEDLYSLLYKDKNSEVIEIEYTGLEHIVKSNKTKKNLIITEYYCYFKGQQVGRYELHVHNNDHTTREFEAFSTMNVQRNESKNFINSLKIDYAMRETLKKEIAIYTKSKEVLGGIRIKNLGASILKQICINAKNKGVSSIWRETEAYTTGKFYGKVLQDLQNDKTIQQYNASVKNWIAGFTEIAKFEVII